MEENNLFHERYFLERLLGRGNFSEVWLAKDTETDIEVALKIYAPATGLDDHGLNVLSREFAIVVNANHKNLLKPLYYASSKDRKPYLVLPYCKNGSIMKDIGRFTEIQAWHLLRDVASGLAFLHAMQPTIIHQDIKPDNIMIGNDGETYMITDFGVSTHVRSTLRKSIGAFSSAGTIAYMAPERFSKNNTPIPANDIYSLGATIYEMLTGDVPFGDQGGLFQKSGAEIPELTGYYSDDLKKVLNMCLQLNPEERPTAEQLEKWAQTFIDGGEPFPKPLPLYKKHKNTMIMSASMVAVVAVVSLFILLYEPSEVKLTGISKATHLMKGPKTADEGFRLLEDMAKGSGNEAADATYLLSRLYFKSKGSSDNVPDSVRLMQNALNIKTDFKMAHELLLKVVAMSPQDYHALYELGCDFLGGEDRTEAVDRDIKKADEYFTKALQYAKMEQDQDYVDRINIQMEKYKDL